MNPGQPSQENSAIADALRLSNLYLARISHQLANLVALLTELLEATQAKDEVDRWEFRERAGLPHHGTGKAGKP
jgi:hypothetical protein